jgi:hypothetical protein
MPSPYAHDVLRLKAEIVARVDAGRYLRSVCATPGAPAEETVRRWAKADPVFADALAQAQRRGTHRRLYAFDEAKAAAFLERARAGETINALIGQPGMPSRATYTYWNRTLPWFAEATFALRRRRDARTGTMGRARLRVFDQAVADKIVVRFNSGPTLKALLASDPELPSREVVTRWRREQPEFDEVLKLITAGKRRRGPPVPKARVEDVVDHIIQGGSFLSHSRLPDGPSYNTLRRWMRDPNFRDEVAKACEWREEWYADRIQMAAERTAPGSVCDKARAIGPLKRQIVRLRNRPTKPLYPQR